MADVVKLEVVSIGDGFHVDADDLLDKAKGLLLSAIIIGRDKEGDLFMSMTDGGPQSLWLLEHARRQLLSDDDV